MQITCNCTCGMDIRYKEDVRKVYYAVIDFFRRAEGTIYIEDC